MRIGIVIIAVLCIGLLGASLWGGLFGGKNDLAVNLAQPELSGEEEHQPKQVFVHILGCVENPGVYQCEEGSRLSEVIHLAGGFTDDAAEGSVNLASMVSDGAQITVLSKEESSAPKGDVASGENSSPGVASSGKININTASATQLTALNGIGVATAEKIVSYREKNGPFSSIQDLTNVSGIGEKRLESLKDHITV